MNTPDTAKAYIVDGGIASLSAAVLLIRDGGFRGANIRILEGLNVAGGAPDGSGDALYGYVTRGGRMWTEEACVCLWDVLDSIPTLADPTISVKDEVWAFNDAWRSSSHARLIGWGREVLDATDLGFDLNDRLELMRLLAMSERIIGVRLKCLLCLQRRCCAVKFQRRASDREVSRIIDHERKQYGLFAS